MKTKQVNDITNDITNDTTDDIKNVKSINFEYKLYNLFNCIKHLDNLNIKATEKGLEIWGMDASNTILTQVSIDKENLRSYDFKEPIEITTDIDYLKIVKRLYMVKAYIDEKMMIFEEGKTKIEMPVFEKESREMPNLDLKKAVSFDLSTTEIRKVLKDIEAIGSESFELEFKDKLAVFTAQGDYGKLTKTLEPYEKGIKKFEKSKDSIGVWLSAELFRNALNGMDNRTRITIGENSPVIVENQGYTHEASEYEVLPTQKVRHIVAPRSSEDF